MFHNHIKHHYLKYVISIVSLILVTFALTGVFKSQADTVPTFSEHIRYVAPGYRVVQVEPIKVTADSEGNLYVLGSGGVEKFNTSSESVLKFADDNGGTQLSNPSGIVIDGVGNIYISDTGNHRIQKFDSSGVFISQFGTLGTGNGQFDNPQSIALDSLGNLYVADGANHRIQKFDSSGNYLSQFGTYGTGDGEFDYPAGITFDSVGDMYITDNSNSRIQKFDSDGVYISQFGTFGTGDGELTYPASNVALDNTGNIYVVDSGNHRIQKFDSSGVYISQFGGEGIGAGQFTYPSSLFLDSSGNMYVTDSAEYPRLQKLDSSGTYLEEFKPYGLEENEFNSLSEIAIDSSGNIYGMDPDGERVVVITTAGELVVGFGENGTGNGQFQNARGIAVDSSGNIYVADAGNHRVQKFTSSGVYISQFGEEGAGNGQFNNPQSIILDSEGNIYVTDVSNNRIQKFDSSGNYLSQFGTGGSGNGQFYNVLKIAFDSFGNIYATDLGNGRIQKFDSSGNYLSQFGTYGTGDGEFDNPTSVTVDSQDNIYVTDGVNNRVQKFDANGVYVSQFGTFGSGDGQFSDPTDIIVTPAGNIYVSDANNKRISVWQTTPTTPSVISNIEYISEGSTTTISWTTDALSSSKVEFGLTTLYGSTTPEINTSPRVTDHTVTITGLVSCASYHYRVKSVNAALALASSSDRIFETNDCTGDAEIIENDFEEADVQATTTVMLDTITLVVPPDFSTTTTSAIFQVNKIDPVTFTATAGKPSGTDQVGTSVFHLVAIATTTATALTTFDTPITISLTYTANDIANILESSLTIYRYDGNQWNALSSCTRDTSLRTVTCQTNQFSDFALYGTAVQTSGSVILGASGFVNPGTGGLSTTPVISQASSTIPTLTQTTSTFSRFLYRGVQGNDVSLLQSILFEMGSIYPEGLITGYYGPLTYAAIKRYQCFYNIVCEGDEVTTGWGVFGPLTRQKLGR